MDPSNIKIRATTISDYEALFASLHSFAKAGNGKQPGDPTKGVDCMIDVLKGEGVAKGRTMPKRLPLGLDTIESVKTRCNELIGIVNEWEDVIGSTNYDEENQEDFLANMPKHFKDKMPQQQEI